MCTLGARCGLLVAIMALVVIGCSDDSGEGSSITDTSSNTDTIAETSSTDMAEDMSVETSDDSDMGQDGSADMDADTTPMVEPANYARLENWLCHPDQASADNVCDISLDVTMVAADGTATQRPHPKATDPTFDCFYVYPTISTDFRVNSDLAANEAEVFVTRFQAARYGEVCRLFAPMYQQVTLAGLFKNIATPEQLELLNTLVQGDPDPNVAYADVAAAFQHYLDNDSTGRPFLLIGHSQGTGHLRRLMEEVIEPDVALRDRLVAAHLIGSSVFVPPGQVVGGTFNDIPLCERNDQAGCVVSFASYRATAPPDDNAVFGNPSSDGTLVSACTNPAALGGGRVALRANFVNDEPTELLDLAALFMVDFGGNTGAYADPERNAELMTYYYGMPGLLEGECVERNGRNVLEITVLADPDDPRVDDISGDTLPGWGLHLFDMAFVMEDLVELARRQGDAWAQR